MIYFILFLWKENSIIDEKDPAFVSVFEYQKRPCNYVRPFLPLRTQID